tara:strand:- start:367 stop:600 length:234 start_codon:yes stop_codon:yes gene_type:complete
MIEILLILAILYLAYQVIMIPIWAFGFWGTVFLLMFGIPLIIIVGGWFFANPGSVFAISVALCIFTIIGYALTDNTA